ncbi:hypothetical protein BD779DRAFT_1472913 [Infundibulicybe gibba]|nr:hypothetical protein BD779DRAFT_1472913 [Infundibulicybe gibba]
MPVPFSTDDDHSTIHARNYAHARVVKEHCDRFRILVMGKRNAGKTTILHRMTDSDEGGQTIDNGPGFQRGLSNIHDEITFPSSPGFVFHDSRGIEAGSLAEVDTLKEFIAARAKLRDLSQRLHTRAFSELRRQGATVFAAKKQAAVKAFEEIREIVTLGFKDIKCPPAGYVCLQEMNQSGSDCSELLHRTAEVIDEEVLGQLFSAVKQKAVEVAMRAALRVSFVSRAIWDAQRAKKKDRIEQDIVKMLIFFPKWPLDVFLPQRKASASQIAPPSVAWATYDVDAKVEWLDPNGQSAPRILAEAAKIWLRPNDSVEMRRLITFVYVCVISESLTWEETDTPWTQLEEAIRKHRTCPGMPEVGEFVRRLFPDVTKVSRTVLVDKLMAVVMETRLRISRGITQFGQQRIDGLTKSQTSKEDGWYYYCQS